MKHSRDGRPGWQQASAQLEENPSKSISISVEIGMMSSVAGRSYYDLKRMKGRYYSTSARATSTSCNNRISDHSRHREGELL